MVGSPRRRARGPRATGRRSAIRSKPNLRAAVNAVGVRRNAAIDNGLSAATVPYGSTRVRSVLPKRASAWAAPGVSATATRAVKPARRQKAIRRRQNRSSPPWRWSQPARSIQRPSAGVTAAIGDQRRTASSARRSRSAASASGSTGRKSRSDTSARAWVAAIPG